MWREGTTRLQSGSISGKLPKDISEAKVKISRSPEMCYFPFFISQKYSFCSQFCKEGLPKLLKLWASEDLQLPLQLKSCVLNLGLLILRPVLCSDYVETQKSLNMTSGEKYTSQG